MSRWIIVGFIIFSFNLVASAQEKKSNVLSDVAATVKCAHARQSFLAGDIEGALKLYLEANNEKPGDASIEYRIGECYYNINDFENAIEFWQKAEASDTGVNGDIHLNMGMVLLEEDQPDNSLRELNIHKQKYIKDIKKLVDDDVEKYIDECKTAMEMEAHPKDVKINDLGDNINSPFDEKSPSVTADGRILIFNSNRPYQREKSKAKNKEKSKEEKSEPGGIYDNVYISKWDSSSNDWGLSYPIEGDINEPGANTGCTSISSDGSQIFLYINNQSNALGGDIFVSKISRTGKWSKPLSLGKPVNTSYYEDGGCISPDGNTLYFVSERPGGFGGGDIYKSEKIGRNSWTEPVNLGPGVNTKYDEGGPFIAPDGKTLFFSSTGHKSMGDYDIFKSVLNDSGKWSMAVNLGYPINSVNSDKNFTLSADVRTAYISSNRKGGLGGRDIWKVDLSNYPLLASDIGNKTPVGYSIIRGKVTDIKGIPVQEAPVSVLDSADALVAKLKTDATGLYFITIRSNSNYKLKVSGKGYKLFTKSLHLPSSPTGTFTMQMDVMLEKQ